MLIKLKIFKIHIFTLLMSLSNACVYAQEKITNSKEAEKLYELGRKNFSDFKNKESIKNAELVLIYALKTNNKSLAAKTYNLLGLNFELYADAKKAISYYKKGIDLATEAKNDTVNSWLYNNLGGLYTYNKLSNIKSLEYFKQAYKHSLKSNDKIEIVVSGLNIADNLIGLKKYKEGKKYLDEIKSKVEESKETDAKLLLYSAYANYYDEYEKDFGYTEINYLKAIQVGEADKDASVKLNLLEIYESASDFYKKNNKMNEAYKYLKLHDELQDDLYDEKRQDVLKGVDQSIQLGEINTRIEKVEKENKSYLKKLQNNKYYFVLFGTLITLFIALLYFLNKNYSKNIKINKKLKSTNVQLHKAKQKTEEATQLKSQFMSTVSHELRTPLYGVIGLTEIIENEHPELKDSKLVKSLQFSAKYLLTLINDILNLSKIEDDKVHLNIEDVSLLDEVETIVESLKIIAKQYHNKISIQFNENVPKFIKTDKTRLSQVLINLISNSLKFTKNGEVILKCNFDEINSKLKFQIIDNGIGIPKIYLDKVFEKFTQVDRTTTEEQFQGTGLGLAIVKKIIDLFNGKIKIESEENVGTIIYFEIPYLEGNQTVNLVKQNNIELKNIKILVVEDNKINQMVTKKLLQKNELDCTIAIDGYDALEIVSKETFDIILMDIHMPGINGFETTEKIKELGINTPIVALTAADKNELEADIIKYKMADILIKPFEFCDLKKILEKHV
jgi:signal transduction histidine kinase/CheY-like chemotaxis protein